MADPLLGPRAVYSVQDTGIKFDSLTKLIAAFGTLTKEMKLALGPEVLAAANILADQARSNAKFSTRIPQAIYAKASLTSHSAAIVGVKASAAPEAKVLELGNTFREGLQFRHPVFGHTDRWVVQDTHPYLFPAVQERNAEVNESIAASVAAVARSVGLTII